MLAICMLLTAACGSDSDASNPGGNKGGITPPVRGDLISADNVGNIIGTVLDAFLVILKSSYGLNASIVREYDVKFTRRPMLLK